MKHLQKANSKIGYVYAVAVIMLLVSAGLGILVGATKISLPDFLKAVTSLDSPDGKILRYVRLPRVLGSLLCGGALAVSGAVIQGVLANRLASPSIIGVNAGAGLAVTLSATLGIAGGWRLSAFAFAGSA